MGPHLQVRDGGLSAHGRHVAGRRGHAAGDQSHYARAKDKFGLPVANVHYDDHPNDIAIRNHAYKQGAAVYEAVGATAPYPTPAYPSTHNMGTNRISAKARDGVVNKFGQTHDVKNLFVSDGSQFTSGAACNPTLTIIALAIRQADHIAGAMQKKEI